jgi:phage-related protein
VLIQGTVTLITALAARLPEICMVLIEAIPQIIEAILSAFEPVVDGIGRMFADAWASIKNAFASAPEWFRDIFDTAKTNIEDAFGKVKDIMSKIWQNIKDVFSKVGTWFKDRFTEAKKNIEDAFGKIGEFFSNVWENIKSAFHIEDALNWGKDLISNFVAGIKNGWVELKEGLGELGNKISDFIGFSEPKVGPLSDFHTYAPDMLKLFADGIKSNTGIVTDAIEDAFNFQNAITMPQMEVKGNYTGISPNNDIYLKKMVELMQKMVDNGMHVELEGDARSIFKVVEEQNRVQTKATGYNQLSMKRAVIK